MTHSSPNAASSFDTTSCFTFSPFLHHFGWEDGENGDSERPGRGGRNAGERGRKDTADVRRAAPVSSSLSRSVFAELCRNPANPDLATAVKSKTMRKQFSRNLFHHRHKRKKKNKPLLVVHSGCLTLGEQHKAQLSPVSTDAHN